MDKQSAIITSLACTTILSLGYAIYISQSKELPKPKPKDPEPPRQKCVNIVCENCKEEVSQRPEEGIEGSPLKAVKLTTGSPPYKKKKDTRCEDLNGRLLKDCGIEDIYMYDIKTLGEFFPSFNIENFRDRSGMASMAYNKIMGKEDFIIGDLVRSHIGKGSSEAFVRAGPRHYTHFDPEKVTAAIVTCGGLCPGLNNVVRELTHSLYHLYHAKRVIGIRGGFNGFHENCGFEPIELTIESVKRIHHDGGTMLGSSRGGFDLEFIMAYLVREKVDQLYIIGGDGTHRGANIISEECFRRKMNVSVAGIPKTIDNDVDVIDRSFGFNTSVEAAQAAIRSAKIEAQCNIPNGIGIVKLMGRSAGFIATHATMASGDVDLCLVPEVSIDLDTILPFLEERVAVQGHAVVVVAEGAGEDLIGQSGDVDAGGNRKLPPIGLFIKQKIEEHFKMKGKKSSVKFIDPSYMIRSVPPNASDALYCMLLAQNAVHGAMAGYTAFSTGLVNNRVVYLPIERLVATSPRVMDPRGRTWERLLSITGQPEGRSNVGAKISKNDRICI